MASDRIVGNISTEDKLFGPVPLIGDISTLDALTAFGPGFLVMFIGQSVAPQSAQLYVLLTVALVVLIGVLGLIAAPNHTSLGKYAARFWHHKRRPAKVRYRRKSDPEDVLDRSVIEYDERTQDLTEVDKIYPQYDVIELEDGTIVGAVEVFAGNLDTADQSLRNAIVRSVKDFFNNTLDFPITFYITTHGFEPGEYLTQYEDRSDDDEILENQILQFYVNHHQRWVRTTMGGRPMREYYVLIPVKEQEVYDSLGGEETVADSLGGLPVIGSIIGSTSDDDEYELSQSELRLKQISLVDERANTLLSGFVGAIGDEADGERVNSAHFASLLKEYWEGEQVNRDDVAEMIGMMPVVVGEDDLDD